MYGKFVPGSGTFMLVVNNNGLLAFHSVCHVLFRDKTRSLGSIILRKAVRVDEVRNDN